MLPISGESEKPKPASFQEPSGVIQMFSGDRSRWTILAVSWRKTSPSQMCIYSCPTVGRITSPQVTSNADSVFSLTSLGMQSVGRLLNMLHMFPREQVTRSVTKTISFGFSGITSITFSV